MKRYTLIDSLRGIAAMMVVIGHLSLTVEDSFDAYMPEAVNLIFKAGHFGVEIFFVISGFVILHSVRNGHWNLAFLANFGLRRSIRLDPPYWLIIALEIVLIYVSLHFFPDLGTPEPNFRQIAAHLFYLQELLGLGHLLPVFWTLCYEVQFYLVLVGSLVLLTSLRQKFSAWPQLANMAFILLAVFSYLLSLGIFLQFLPASMPGLFIDRWYQFMLGALAWWCTIGRGSGRVFIATWSATLLILWFAPASAEAHMQSTLVILAVSMLLYVAGRNDKLSSWLQAPGLLFLGSISYGLYLTHLPIGWRLIALEKKLLGDELSLGVASAALLSGIVISLFSAWLLHIYVEKPSLNLAHRIKLK